MIEKLRIRSVATDPCCDAEVTVHPSYRRKGPGPSPGRGPQALSKGPRTLDRPLKASPRWWGNDRSGTPRGSEARRHRRVALTGLSCVRRPAPRGPEGRPPPRNLAPPRDLPSLRRRGRTDRAGTLPIRPEAASPPGICSSPNRDLHMANIKSQIKRNRQNEKRRF